MAKAKRSSLLRTGPLLVLLVATVVVPGLLFISVGIVALALSRQAFDIVLGVLALVFAVMSATGGFVAVFFLRRSERLAQMQTDFVANVSHELRTPLAAIRLLADTLAAGRAPVPEQREQVYSLLKEQVGRLQDLVERLLRWRQLESGAARGELKPESVASVIEDALRLLTATPGTMKAKVELRVDPDLPAVLADREALADALRNLLDNAVKFGADNGPVEIVARSSGDEVIIEVRDQGPGIPRAERKRIFERFYRVPLHLRSKQGIGLGLAIVRHVVQWHRGRVRVESEPGIGTAFIIHLRAADEDERGGQEPAVPARRAMLEAAHHAEDESHGRVGEEEHAH